MSKSNTSKSIQLLLGIIYILFLLTSVGITKILFSKNTNTKFQVTSTEGFPSKTGFLNVTQNAWHTKRPEFTLTVVAPFAKNGFASPTPNPSINPFILSITNTIQPTSSPTFTPTSPPPVVYPGTGNQRIDLTNWQSPSIITFTYMGTDSFKVVSHGLLGEPLSILVETNGAYSGSQAINTSGSQMSAMEIQTNGNWKAEIRSLAQAPFIELPVKINSQNSQVYRLDSMIYELSINTQKASGWVSIIGYGDNNHVHILLNEYAPFTKTIVVKDPDINTLEINTLGNWSIDLK